MSTSNETSPSIYPKEAKLAIFEKIVSKKEKEISSRELSLDYFYVLKYVFKPSSSKGAKSEQMLDCNFNFVPFKSATGRVGRGS